MADEPKQKGSGCGTWFCALIILAIMYFWAGAQYGWDKFGPVRIPYVSGPTKAEIRSAMREGWSGDSWQYVEVIKRWPTVAMDPGRDKDCRCRRGTILYPLTIKGKFVNDQMETLGFYFYKDEFGKWHDCYEGN